MGKREAPVKKFSWKSETLHSCPMPGWSRDEQPLPQQWACWKRTENELIMREASQRCGGARSQNVRKEAQVRVPSC